MSSSVCSSASNGGTPSSSFRSRERDVRRLGHQQLRRRRAPRQLARDARDAALELAHARLARVQPRHRRDHVGIERHELRIEAVRRELPRHEELARDRVLLVIDVARQPDDLHAVAQRLRNLRERVRGRDEQHLREIVVDFEIVIVEGGVLLRIEHLEQRADGSPRQSCPILSTSSSRITGFTTSARRIAWITRPGSEPMYVRRCPRISASSRTPPSDMRTKRAAERARDGAAQRRLADAGRHRRGRGSDPRAVRPARAPRCSRECDPSHRRVRSDPRRARPARAPRPRTSSLRSVHGSATIQSR